MKCGTFVQKAAFSCAGTLFTCSVLALINQAVKQESPWWSYMNCQEFMKTVAWTLSPEETSFFCFLWELWEREGKNTTKLDHWQVLYYCLWERNVHKEGKTGDLWHKMLQKLSPLKRSIYRTVYFCRKDYRICTAKFFTFSVRTCILLYGTFHTYTVILTRSEGATCVKTFFFRLCFPHCSWWCVERNTISNTQNSEW